MNVTSNYKLCRDPACGAAEYLWLGISLIILREAPRDQPRRGRGRGSCRPLRMSWSTERTGWSSSSQWNSPLGFRTLKQIWIKQGVNIFWSSYPFLSEYSPVLKGAEESGMIGENIEGFISCMGSGVRGVSDPPAMTMLWEWDQWLIVSIDCGEGAGPTQWRRKVERFPSFYVPCLASRRPDKSCLIAVFVWNLTWENGPSGGSAQDKWLDDNMSGQHFFERCKRGN